MVLSMKFVRGRICDLINKQTEVALIWANALDIAL
jgi:hypothetical protein